MSDNEKTFSEEKIKELLGKEASQLTEEEKKAVQSFKLKRRLTREEYDKARLMYERDGASLEAIAKELGVSVFSIHRRFKKDGVKKNSYQVAAHDKVKSKAAQRAAENAETIILNGELMREFAMNSLRRIQVDAMRLYIENAQNGKPPSAIREDQKAMEFLIRNIKSCVEAGNMIVESYKEFDERELPVLTIRSMKPEDEERIRREQEALDEMEDGELMEKYMDDDGDEIVVEGDETPGDQT